MKPAEWIRICNHVLDLWGNSTAWLSAKDAAYDHARRLDYDVAYEKVDAAVLEGLRFPPSPSEIIAATKNAGGVELLNVLSCSHTDDAARCRVCVAESRSGVEEMRRKLEAGWHSFRPGPSGCAVCGVAFDVHDSTSEMDHSR